MFEREWEKESHTYVHSTDAPDPANDDDDDNGGGVCICE